MIDQMNSLYIKYLSIFKNVEENRIDEIASLVRIKQYALGSIINYGSDERSKIYFVIKGKVKVTELDIENELIKDVLTDGEIFGDLQLDGEPKDYEYCEVLIDKTIIAYFFVSDFLKILEAFSKVAIIYAKRISMKLKRLEKRHSDLMFRDVRSRLFRFIKNWAKIEGNTNGDKIILENYLTHKDIAAMISTSRQTVCILFREMKDSGLINYNRKLIQLNHVEAWN